MKTITLAIRVSEEDSNLLKEVAKILDVPYAQIAREGLRKEIEKLKTDPMVNQRLSEMSLSV
jgi:predicted nucleotidyltransferase